MVRNDIWPPPPIGFGTTHNRDVRAGFAVAARPRERKTSPPDDVFVADVGSFHLGAEVGHEVEVSRRGTLGFVRVARRFEYRHLLLISLPITGVERKGDIQNGGKAPRDPRSASSALPAHLSAAARSSKGILVSSSMPFHLTAASLAKSPILIDFPKTKRRKFKEPRRQDGKLPDHEGPTTDAPTARQTGSYRYEARAPCCFISSLRCERK